MKKNVIAILLSIVMAVGGVGAPVFAAEDTTAQEAVEDSEEGTTEEEPAPKEEEESAPEEGMTMKDIRLENIKRALEEHGGNRKAG